ncbi:hypothetical protein [Alkalimarinus sediminis]|uniref:Uncharacterized protein n=2 Tax=Alkalimarinus sediminis TaxID=1632866 RepID=A0A9E8HF63_9ALTE|nr:hypothetical protein [Alkalimarinus sediminis]UZW73515.1 hypothetical protein NNL22_10720 [Alkalimarinus sediminis]
MAMSLSGLMITFLFICKNGLLVLPTSIVRCDATESTIFLTQKNGLRIEVTPLSSTYMSPTILLLAWKPAQPSSSSQLANMKALFTPASLTTFTVNNVSSQEDFRRLRVLLKFRKSNATK